MKKSLATGSVLAGFILLIFLGYARTTIAQGSNENSQIQIGMNIAPVRLDLKGKNRSLVGLGSYIVNAQGGCNDCHTWRITDEASNAGSNYEEGGDPFLGQPEQIYAAGYLAGGRKFGPFTSRNLTPNGNGLPAGLSLDKFIEPLRTGVDSKNRHPQISPLLQVMPWPVYANMTDRDLKAVYEFLSSIPCVGSPTRCSPTP
jgi:hypothetical protein